MLPGGMSPEMVRLAQEQMSKMSPEDLRRMQQMMTPEMMSAAQEQMKHMRPQDVEFAARQMQNLSPDQIAQMMASARPGGSGVPAGYPGGILQQRQQYEYNAAATLKAEGNRLHGSGCFELAAEKYSRARNNLAGHSSSEAQALRQTCTLNLMSCYLKLGQYEQVVPLGSEVLTSDQNNVKALYRRGQAYQKLGLLKEAVGDLELAARLSPEDEVLAGVLRDTQKELGDSEGGNSLSVDKGSRAAQERRAHDAAAPSESTASVLPTSTASLPCREEMTIEDVTEAETSATSAQHSTDQSFSAMPVPPSSSPTAAPSVHPAAPSIDPVAVRNMQRMMQALPPEQLAALSGGSLSAPMAKMVSQMVATMPPEELQRMVELAAKFGPTAGVPGTPGLPTGATLGGPAASPSTSFSPGAVPGSAASNDLQLEGRHSESLDAASSSSGGAGLGAAGLPAGMPPGGAQQLMDDPKMMAVMAEMMRTLSPEDIASMSEQMGMKMSVEQAKQTKELMSKVGPERLATMMKWANRVQRPVAQVRQLLYWFFSQPMLVLALVILIVGVLGRYWGWF